MSTSHKGTRIANIFGSFGYLSIVVQWFWFIAVIVLPYLEGSSLKSIFLPAAGEKHHAVAATINMPPFMQLIIAGLAIIFTLAITIYAIYMIPRSIGKVGKTITQKSAQVTISHIKHHHKPLTKRERKRLFEYATWSVKLLLLLIPCVLLLLPAHARLTIPHEVILLFGAFCAGMSLVWFGLQYAISRFSHSDPREIW